MIFPFRYLPGRPHDTPRPLVEVAVAHENAVDLVALCDTGALHNRFAAWVADDIGLDLRDVEPEPIGVGGQHLLARTVTVPLEVGGHGWEAPVSFCEPWPWSYQLLGQEGFFRWFEVRVRAADRELELTAINE